jgi:UDP-N-acetylmuramoylalanine--D-glutamate ligase
MPDKNNNKIIIIGYGHEGRFALSYLKKKYPQAKFTVIDRNKINFAEKNIKFFYGKDYLKHLKGYDLIVRTQSVPPDRPELKAAVKSGVELTSITKIFFHACRGQIIGVTGTKGKSTTSTLIYNILKKAGKKVFLVGNIGHNPLANLDRDNGKGKIFVYELSSYQLSDLDKSPKLSLFLSIFPDHMPFHGSFAKYRDAKANVVRYQKTGDYFVYNSSYPFIKSLAKKSPAKKIDYLKLCTVKNDCIFYGKEKILPLKDVKILGRHNLENIFSAICTAKILKIKNEAIASAIAVFRGLDHRLELVGSFKGIYFYDDAISTTPESTMAAIDTFGQQLETIILGGLDRGYDFKKLAERISKSKIQNIVLFPESGKKIWSEIKKIYKKKKLKLPNHIETKNMSEAVKFCYERTSSGKICLLSTASPSFSIFKDYKEKGDLFKSEILNKENK